MSGSELKVLLLKAAGIKLTMIVLLMLSARCLVEKCSRYSKPGASALKYSKTKESRI